MELTLWRSDVEMSHPVAAARQRHDVRTRLFLRLEHDGTSGFGEVAPQLHALAGDPSVRDVLDELVALTLPQLRDAVRREGAVPSWTRIARFAGARPASPFAVALVEMAVLDREMRDSGEDVDGLWPARFETPLQSTVSLLDPEDEWAVDPAAHRVRVKTAPGSLDPRSFERLAGLGRPVLLDFNCSATSDEEVIEQVGEVSRVATVAAVEQPYAPGNVVDHARLAEHLSVPVSLDEGVRSTRDLGQIVRYSAARIVCVKPARVGGLANARTVILRAGELGLRPYLGGFFESPYARHVHRRLAFSCVTEPSDLGPVAVVGDGPQVEPVPGGFGIAPSAALLSRAEVLSTYP